MDSTSGKLTVYFEAPFWIGVFERIADGKLTACKVTFGAEPKDSEVWEFVLRHYDELRFSPAVEAAPKPAPDNPKRRQRDAQKQLLSSGAGTKSQQALQLQRESLRADRRQAGKARREAEQQRRFDLKKLKRQQKHRGH